MTDFQSEIDALTRKCFGNTDLVEQLIDRFRASLPTTVDSILTATQENDLDTAGKLAHRLKGEASTMCATQLSSGAGLLYEAVNESSQEIAIELAGQLVHQAQSYCKAAGRQQSVALQ